MAIPVETRIKSWITPSLITCFGALCWSLLDEMRADVKALLESNAQVQVRIQSLERRIDGLEGVIYPQRVYALKPEEIDVPKKNR